MTYSELVERLFLKSGQIITQKWYEDLVELLNYLNGQLNIDGRLPLSKMPDGEYGKVLIAQGIGNDPVYADPDCNIIKISGTSLTPRDWSLDFEKLQNLDITLSALLNSIIPARSSVIRDLSSHTINANGIAEITKSDLNGWSALVVVVKANYSSSATNGIRVRWLYSPDGSNFDSVEDAETQANYENLTFSAGAIRQRTILIPIFTNYIKIQIVNLDSSYPVTVDVWSLNMR